MTTSARYVLISASLCIQARTDEPLTALTAYWFRTAKASGRDWYLHIDLHGGNSSAAATRATPYATPYVHRDCLHMYCFYDQADTTGRFPADGFSWIEDFLGNITASMDPSERCQYIDYPDPKRSQDLAQNRY